MIHFYYRPLEHKWAETTITAGDNRFEMAPTLIFSDPLAELASLVAALLQHSDEEYPVEVGCVWHDEPGQWRWLLAKQGGQVRIQILRFNSGQENLANDQGQVVFAAEGDLVKFAIQVKTQLREIKDEIGPEPYQTRTGAPFPEATLAKLSKLIRAEQLKRKSADPV
jgi:hypothetical protein